MAERLQGRILIVDDDDDLRDLLVAGLTASGYECIGCASACGLLSPRGCTSGFAKRVVRGYLALDRKLSGSAG